MTRVRLVYSIGTMLAIIAGLGTRMLGGSLPVFIAEHFGDSLWASMIYFGFRALWPSHKREGSLVSGFLFCMAIEFSQLYQAEWLNAVRAAAIGGLVLGQGFLPVDLIRYGAGAIFAYGADRLISYLYIRRKKESKWTIKYH